MCPTGGGVALGHILCSVLLAGCAWQHLMGNAFSVADSPPCNRLMRALGTSLYFSADHVQHLWKEAFSKLASSTVACGVPRGQQAPRPQRGVVWQMCSRGGVRAMRTHLSCSADHVHFSADHVHFSAGYVHFSADYVHFSADYVPNLRKTASQATYSGVAI
jgi:hypothetical protein